MNPAWHDALDDFATRLTRQGRRRRALSPRTRAAYVKDARLLGEWLAARGVDGPAAVTPSALDAALRDLGWSASTRARALTAAREWLAPYFPPGRSPADRVARPRVNPPLVTRISQDEARALLDAVGHPVAAGDDALDPLALRNRALVELLYGSGLRRQEACDVRLGDVDFEHDVVRVAGKGGHVRTVPLTEPSVAALRDWITRGRPVLAANDAGRARDEVFLSRSGRPMDGSSVYRVVSTQLRRIGRSGGPHVLRHAAATHLLEGPPGREGAHLRVVQEVLGHASLATTQRYTGVTTRDIQGMLRRGHPRG